MPVLEARGLCKSYHPGTPREVQALRDVSLEIERGSFWVLTGPSGSGKTTLLAILGALERPTAGRVLWDGRDLTDASEGELARVRRRFGFVFQGISLIPGLAVWENVAYPLVPRGIRRRQRQRTAADWLSRLGMGDRLSARPEELSTGQQQRVALARAMAGDPRVLFADEPTSNLDPATAEEVVRVFLEFHRTGNTILLATHDPALTGLAGHRAELNGGVLR